MFQQKADTVLQGKINIKGNRFSKMDEKPSFSGTKNGPVQRTYLAACAAAQMEVLLLNGTTEECGFSPTYCLYCSLL
jgi:hypothetical protein